MNPELESKLVEKYPKLFSQYGKPIEDSCMGWGMTHGDGWYEIIDTLCYEIQWITDWFNRTHPNIDFQPVAAQVKEKNGTLRFYVDFVYSSDIPSYLRPRLDGTMDMVSGMIRMAEAISQTTCEVCGSKGKLSDEPFPVCRCEKCSRKGIDSQPQER